MKNLLLFAVIALFSIFLSSCSNRSEEKQKITQTIKPRENKKSIEIDSLKRELKEILVSKREAEDRLWKTEVGIVQQLKKIGITKNSFFGQVEIETKYTYTVVYHADSVFVFLPSGKFLFGKAEKDCGNMGFFCSKEEVYLYSKYESYIAEDTLTKYLVFSDKYEGVIAAPGASFRPVARIKNKFLFYEFVEGDGSLVFFPKDTCNIVGNIYYNGDDMPIFNFPKPIGKDGLERTTPLHKELEMIEKKRKSMI